MAAFFADTVGAALGQTRLGSGSIALIIFNVVCGGDYGLVHGIAIESDVGDHPRVARSRQADSFGWRRNSREPC